MLLVVAAAVLAGVPAQATVHDEAPGIRGTEIEAVYGDQMIDLSQGWQGAGACVVWPDVLDRPECFDTEAGMDRRIAELEATDAIPPVDVVSGGTTAVSGSSCASYLRLYDDTFYTGAVLYLRAAASGSTLWTSGSMNGHRHSRSAPARPGSPIGTTAAETGIRHRLSRRRM